MIGWNTCIRIFALLAWSHTSAAPTAHQEPGSGRTARETPEPGDVQETRNASARTGGLQAVLTTARGEIRIQLLSAEAPVAVASFVNLVQRGFYDGLTFDRVVGKTAVEGGCPLGKGVGWPGYKFEDEFTDALRHDRPGRVSLLNAGPNSNGCRFTITMRSMPTMDGRNTIFGQVRGGLDVVQRLEPGDKIESVKIVGDPAPLLIRFAGRIENWNRALDARYSHLRASPIRHVAPSPTSPAPEPTTPKPD